MLILELKPLSEDLKYAFLGPKEIFLVVILVHLEENHEKHLLSLLYMHKVGLGWNMMDIKGMDPLIFIHCIALEKDAKPIKQIQRRLNPAMKEVVKADV